MDSGNDFLRGQVDDATVLHRAFVDALHDHGREADDPRFGELCARYLPIMDEQQRQLESLRESFGERRGIRARVIGKVVGAARELADAAREDDYRRLVGDIAMSSMAEDLFDTFREAGRILHDRRLNELGTRGGRRHDDFNRDANRLAQAMFVERSRAEDGRGRSSTLADAEAPDRARTASRGGSE